MSRGAKISWVIHQIAALPVHILHLITEKIERMSMAFHVNVGSWVHIRQPLQVGRFAAAKTAGPYPMM